MSEIRTVFFGLLDAVNGAESYFEHSIAEAKLSGFKLACRIAEIDFGVMHADWHTGARYGFPDLADGCPPVCNGVRLDWTPHGYPSHGEVVDGAK